MVLIYFWRLFNNFAVWCIFVFLIFPITQMTAAYCRCKWKWGWPLFDWGNATAWIWGKYKFDDYTSSSLPVFLFLCALDIIRVGVTNMAAAEFGLWWCGSADLVPISAFTGAPWTWPEFYNNNLNVYLMNKHLYSKLQTLLQIQVSNL